MRGCDCQAAVSLACCHPKARQDDITPRHRPPLSLLPVTPHSYLRKHYVRQANPPVCRGNCTCCFNTCSHIIGCCYIICLRIWKTTKWNYGGHWSWQFVELYDQKKLMPQRLWCVTDKTDKAPWRLFICIVSLKHLVRALSIPLGSKRPFPHCLKVLLLISFFHFGEGFLFLLLFVLEHQRQNIWAC